MNLNILELFFKNRNQRWLDSIQNIVDSINNLEGKFKKLSDDALKKKRNFFSIV